VPEDRHKHGLVAPFTVGENAALKSYYKAPFTAHAMLDYDAMNRNAERLIDAFDIRAGQRALTHAGSMSGGNQQKVIVAREIELGPRVLIIAQPTRGLDVGAIEYIRKRIVAERDAGRAVLLVSFELDEIMNLCDRIATISKGSIVAVKDAGTVTEREIGAMMAGERKSA
jgi:simple sugar transport system ATP-binding protein